MLKLNYIGSKHSLLNFLDEQIHENIDLKDKTLIDVFSGTGSVSFHFRKQNIKIISNDLEYYSYIISYACVKSNYNERLKKLIAKLNQEKPKSGLLTKNYSEFGSHRMYFTIENAQKIDAIRNKIDTLTLSPSEYYFLLGSLLVSADQYANVPAIYGSYLKTYKKNALKPFRLEPIHQYCDNNENEVLNEESLEIDVSLGDVIYLDPPYNERQYGKNYHVLNYLAKNEEMEIYGKTGLIKDTKLSDWCSKKNAPQILDNFLSKCSGKIVVMSYNNEGIISHEKIKEIFEKYGELKLVERDYKRFKNFKYNKNGITKEYLWIGYF